MLFLAAVALLIQPSWPVDLLVEEGVHRGTIPTVAVDGKGEWMVTGSEDNTIRVWRLPEVSLERTIYPANLIDSESKNIEQVRAVAMSRDGKEIFAGAMWPRGSQGHHIAVYSRRTGKVLRLLRGLPNWARTLRLDPTGKRLAVLMGHVPATGQGIGAWIVDSQTGKLLFKTEPSKVKTDDAYAGCFDTAGKFYLAYNSGNILRYSAAGVLEKATQLPIGVRTLDIHRDGKLLVAGSWSNSKQIGLIDSNALTISRIINTEAKFGRTVLAAFDRKRDGIITLSEGGELLAFDSEGKRSVSGFVTERVDSPLDMALTDSGIAYAGWGRCGFLAPSGDRYVLNATPSLASVGVSRDAKSVSIDINGRRHILDIEQGVLQPADRDATPMSAPILTHDRIKIEGQLAASKKINGKDVALKDAHRFEYIKCHAVAPDGGRFAVGTVWYVRVLDPQGNELWRWGDFVAVTQVAFSGDGTRLCAVYANGTIRWFDALGGEPLVTVAIGAKEPYTWMASTTTGYYACSPGAGQAIRFVVTDPATEQTRTFSAGRFSKEYFRPDIVLETLTRGNEESAIRVADRGVRDVSGQPILRRLPPVVEIAAVKRAENKLTLEGKVVEPNGKIRSITVLLGKGKRKDIESGSAGLLKDGVFRVTLEDPGDRVGILATNEYGPGDAVFEELVRGAGSNVPRAGGRVLPKGRLLVLAIGVTAYRADSGLTRLEFADDDANAFTESVLGQKGHYSEIISKVLVSPTQTTKRAILNEGFDWLDQTRKPGDAICIFLAGHGLTDKSGWYVFCPSDYDGQRDSKIYQSELAREVSTWGKEHHVLVLIDTCRSGAAIHGNTGLFNELSKPESSTGIIAACTDSQNAQESSSIRHGFFTYALVEILSGRRTGHEKFSLEETDYYLSVARLGAFLSQAVFNLTKASQKPRTGGFSTEEFEFFYIKPAK